MGCTDAPPSLNVARELACLYLAHFYMACAADCRSCSSSVSERMKRQPLAFQLEIFEAPLYGYYS